jgi:putative solute:sodium symporter small subunit
MSAPHRPEPRDEVYWVRNVRLVTALLLVWFAVSFGASILGAAWLDRFRLPGSGFKLGFWMAQQGSIGVFVALIFVYARRMERIDRECGLDEREDPQRERLDAERERVEEERP